MRSLPWDCKFGDTSQDWCDFVQSQADDYDVRLETQDGENMVVFLPDTFPLWNALLISPMFPVSYIPKQKCISFKYRFRGNYPGSIQIYNQFDVMFWTTRGRKILLPYSLKRWFSLYYLIYF